MARFRPVRFGLVGGVCIIVESKMSKDTVAKLPLCCALLALKSPLPPSLYPNHQSRSFPSQGSGFADAIRRGSPHCPQSLPCLGLTRPERRRESSETNDPVLVTLGMGVVWALYSTVRLVIRTIPPFTVPYAFAPLRERRPQLRVQVTNLSVGP